MPHNAKFRLEWQSVRVKGEDLLSAGAVFVDNDEFTQSGEERPDHLRVTAQFSVLTVRPVQLSNG